MESIDILAIANADSVTRAQQMSEVFQQLLGMPAEEREAVLRHLIEMMAENASDEAYRALCETNLTLASTMVDEMLEAFIDLRMSVSLSLPEALSKRDAEMIQEGLKNVEPAVREKIQQYLA